MSTNHDITPDAGPGTVPGTSRRDDPQRTSRWIVPGLCLVLGVGVGVAVMAQGDPGYGIFILLLMTGYALALVLFSRRSETVSLLRGESPDERAASIQTHAIAITGHVLIVVLVGGFIVQLLRGGDTEVWSALCAVGGLTYAVSLFVLHRRS